MGCIAVLDTTNKVTFDTVPLLMVLWFRYLFQALATTGFVLSSQGTNRLQTQQPYLQMLRGLLLFACSFLILGGLLGALVIVRPGGGIPTHATFYPLSMVLTYASFQILTSHMAKTEHPLTMHLYTGWTGTLLASLMVLGWWTTDLSAMDWAKLCLVGFSGTLGHYLLILAYARAPASFITPYLYSSIAFATLLGWLIFDHVPDAGACAGIALIAVCGMASAYLGQKTAHKTQSNLSLTASVDEDLL